MAKPVVVIDVFLKAQPGAGGNRFAAVSAGRSIFGVLLWTGRSPGYTFRPPGLGEPRLPKTE
jgi:hypothetical protein